MRKSVCWCALLAVVGVMAQGRAQEYSRPTVAVELKGDTMVYRSIVVPDARRGVRGRGHAWAAYSHVPWSAQEKLFALSKFWMEVKRNYVYMDRFGVRRWDSLYRAMILPVAESRDDAEFFRLMQGLCAGLRNGRTAVFHSRDFPQTATGFDDGWMLRLIDVGGRVTVSEVSSDKAQTLPPGSEVLDVDGKPVEARLGEAMSRVAASTDRARRRLAVEELLLDLSGTPHEVRFRRPDGGEVTLRLVNRCCEPGREPACVALPGRSWEELHEDFRLTWYPGDVACLKIGTFRPGRVFKAFHDAFPEVKARARKLIVDLRCNDRGSSHMAAEFLSHLSHDTLLCAGIWRTRVYDASISAWGAGAAPEDTVRNARVRAAYRHYNDEAFSEPERIEYRFARDRDDVLEVPTVILVNEATAGAAESFVAIARSQPHMTVVGMPTAGCAGSSVVYELLPGLRCAICTRDIRLAGGEEFVGRGLAPDVTVEDTFGDLLAGRDALLEKALGILRDR